MRPSVAPAARASAVDVTVVVPTYNRARGLGVTLESLVEQRAPDAMSFEVLVVNDGSTDDTAATVECFLDRRVPVRYVAIANQGVAGARNVGVRESRGTWVAFCDDDQVADPGWLAGLYAVAVRSGAGAVGGPRTLDFGATSVPRFGVLAYRLLGQEHLGAVARPYPSDALPNTGNVLVRRAVFHEVGGFDDTFRQGGEDTEFFFRVRASGATLWYAPDAHVRHLIPAARVAPAFLRWVACRIGVADARIDRKHRSAVGHLGRVAWRSAVCAGRDLPLLAAAAFGRRTASGVDARCALAYNVAYLRGSLHLRAPGLFPQATFLRGVDFRSHGGERAITD